MPANAVFYRDWMQCYVLNNVQVYVKPDGSLAYKVRADGSKIQ